MTSPEVIFTICRRTTASPYYILKSLQTHMLDHALYPLLQSAYRKSHSTETALIKVQNDILMNMDRQQVTLLVLLDLSAAFDTIDHQVLLDRLRLSFGIRGCALQWISSYLSDRTQRVSFENNFSQRRYLSYGVPQGSCLGPLLFTMYASKLFDIIKGYLPQTHAYAELTLNCIYHLSLTLHLLKAMQYTPWNAVLAPSDVGWLKTSLK